MEATGGCLLVHWTIQEKSGKQSLEGIKSTDPNLAIQSEERKYNHDNEPNAF